MPTTAEAPRPAGELALVSDLDELEQVEERILALKLSGEEAVQSLLYFIPPAGKRTKPIIGAGVDFVRQLVRRMNQASKGKMRLTLLEQPPVVTDFAIADERGLLRPYVRVVVGAIDKVSGDIKFAIKEVPRDSRHAATIAQEQAERKAFESHPSYNRKLVSKHIRELLKQHGVNPEEVIIAGESGSGQWAAFFAEAARKGIKRDELRAVVREKTGKGLSEVATAAEANRAAQAVHQTLQERAGGAAEGAGATPGPADVSPLPPDVPAAATPDEATELERKTREYIGQLGLSEATVASLKRQVYDPAGAPLENWARLLVVLGYVATAQPREEGLRKAWETYPKQVETSAKPSNS